MRRTVTTYVLGMMMALVIGVATPSVASAELVVLTCPGTVAVSYSPGLTTTPQSTTLTIGGTAGPCIGLPLGIVSLSASGSANGTLSCLLNGGETTVSVTVNWSDGTSSVVSGRFLATVRAGVVVETVVSGTVVSGRFLGATVALTNTVIPDLLSCFTATGITNTAGPATLTIIGT